MLVWIWLFHTGGFSYQWKLESIIFIIFFSHWKWDMKADSTEERLSLSLDYPQRIYPQMRISHSCHLVQSSMKALKKALGKPICSERESRVRYTSYLWSLFVHLEIFPLLQLWGVRIPSKETLKCLISPGTGFVSVLHWTKAHLVLFTHYVKPCPAAPPLDLLEIQCITKAQPQDAARTTASSSRGWAGPVLGYSPLNCARGQVNKAAVWADSCWHSNLSSIALISSSLQTKA